MQFTGWREPISMSGGWQGRLALYCAGGLVFLGLPLLTGAAPAGEGAVGLPDAIAVALRFGPLLDFPEHPDEGRPQADDDPQKQQRQPRDCEHGEHA